MHHALRLFLERRAGAGAESLARLDDIAVDRTFERGATIVRAGDPSDSLHFVCTGAVRSWKLVDDEDVSDYFFFENRFAGDYGALYRGEPARLFLEALEETHAVQLPRAGLLELARSSTFFANLLRVIAESAFAEIELRLQLLHHADLETRYRWTLAHFPELFERVPQHRIASWLGAKPESLSRLRRRLGMSSPR